MQVEAEKSLKETAAEGTSAAAPEGGGGAGKRKAEAEEVIVDDDDEFEHIPHATTVQGYLAHEKQRPPRALP